MIKAYIAFIVLCDPNCKERTYTKEASYSLTICQKHAYGWAIQMYAMTKKEYSYGCEKIEYVPKEIK